MYSPTLGRFIGRDSYVQQELQPTALDNYANGANLYAAYFVPGLLDPSGQICKVDVVITFKTIWKARTKFWAYPYATFTNSPGALLSNWSGTVFGVWDDEGIEGGIDVWADFISDLAGDCCIQSLSISNHGSSGGIQFGPSYYGAAFGNKTKPEEFSDAFKKALEQIKGKMCDDAKVNLYQCGDYEDEEGTTIRHKQIDLLAEYLGVTVQAPDMPTAPWPLGTGLWGWMWYTAKPGPK